MTQPKRCDMDVICSDVEDENELVILHGQGEYLRAETPELDRWPGGWWIVPMMILGAALLAWVVMA